jgi:hypothetical protein
MLAQPRTTPPPCPQPTDRRREPRHPARVEVDIETGDGVAYVGTTLDLSLGGMCVEIAAPLGPDERVRVRFRLSGLPAPLEIDSTVRWVRAQANGLLIAGVSLPALPSRDADALRRFLRDLS